MSAVAVRRATTSQVREVLAVLDEAAAWLTARRVSQWPPAFTTDWVLADLEAGGTWLAWVAGEAVGTLTLTWEDSLWPADHAAGYVHRLARRRWAAGLGTHLLGWADGHVLTRDRRWLRLDCVASNHGLRAYYERSGFRHRGDVAVGGAPGQRLSDGPSTTVSRYERALR